MDNKSKSNCSIAISDSPSKSTSACSSPLPFSALSPIPTTPTVPRKYSMEEIWKNISLSSFHHQQQPTNTTTSATATAALDSLSRPPNEEQQHSSSHEQHSCFVKNALFGSQEPPAETLLSLNSRTEFHCVGSSDQLSKAPSSFILPRLDASNSSTFQRVFESDDSASGDRNKRMMKNRESAARSRARKQAYTSELELKVTRLMKENARLRRRLQLEKLCTSTPAQFPKKHKLRRALTAPF